MEASDVHAEQAHNGEVMATTCAIEERSKGGNEVELRAVDDLVEGSSE